MQGGPAALHEFDLFVTLALSRSTLFCIVDCQQYFHLVNTIKSGWAERFDGLDFMGGDGSLVKGADLRAARNSCELMHLTRHTHLCTGCTRAEPKAA